MNKYLVRGVHGYAEGLTLDGTPESTLACLKFVLNIDIPDSVHYTKVAHDNVIENGGIITPVHFVSLWEPNEIGNVVYDNKIPIGHTVVKLPGQKWPTILTAEETESHLTLIAEEMDISNAVSMMRLGLHVTCNQLDTLTMQEGNIVKVGSRMEKWDPRQCDVLSKHWKVVGY